MLSGDLWNMKGGALPCVALFDVDDLTRAVRSYDIHFHTFRFVTT